jgi:hypothetical protein
MDRIDELIARIQARVADPVRAFDTAAWIRPIFPVPPHATHVDVDAAGAALGFPIPPLLRRLYTEVGNGGWGPSHGLDGIPTGGAAPDRKDLVGLYRMLTSPERTSQSPAVEWPRGLVLLINGHHWDVCDFLRPPYPVFRLDLETWDLERPVRESLIPVAASPTEWLEAWLAGSTDH